jgi:MFS family permease
VKSLSEDRREATMQRAWWIFSVVSLCFFFITAGTFTSLGVVLYKMAAELHWSLSAAGGSYAVLCLTCGLSSPLPALTIKRLGTRWTMVSGCVIIALGFALAAISQSLGLFLVATGLMGLGFTFAANIPAVYLLAAWFPMSAPRIIGFYFMAGALGGVFGPLLVNAVVATSGWRAHWLVMAVAALLIGVLCSVVLTDVAESNRAPTAASGAVPGIRHGVWTARAAMLTRQFIILALAMMVIQTVVTTVHSLIVAHLAKLGLSTAFGALVMSIFGLSDSVAKGVAGTVSTKVGPRQLLIGGLVMLSAAAALLALASSPVIACTFAVILGVGWGTSWLGATLLLLEYFGRAIAAETMSTATLITTVALAGPIVAGGIADVTGSFVPFFYFFAGIMLITALVCATLRTPVPRQSAAKSAAPSDSTLVEADAQ